MELEELLDEAPGASTELVLAHFAPGDADWTSELQWGLLDDDAAACSAVERAANAESGACDAELSGAVARKKKRKKVNPNKARDERRFQLIELQEEVTGLEFTLQRLKAVRNKRPKEMQASVEDSGVPPVWQEICGRQLKRRLEAERENVRLKQRCEREKKLVQNFKKLLFRRRTPRDAEPEATKQTRRTEIPAGYVERMAALVFKELEAGVEVCYHKVESVFATKRPAPINMVPHGSFLDGGVKMKGTERKFYDRRTMPFDVKATGDAWWENWHNYRGQRFQDIAADEIIERFGLEMCDFKTNTSCTAYAQQVSQRHVEDGRTVFVWDAYVEPFGFENERVGGVYFLEQNNVMIQPEAWSSERTDGGNGGCSTRVSTCYVITPYFLDPKLTEDSKTVAVINFLVSALSSNIMALSEMVETLLLDHALQQYGNTAT
ncbi:unnamed protein product [Phytophthora lilii]|uniref:Unnamed protein product n=1 Tax=Phytophthora lilii TaxID=2077276 RepID=A0A9W6WT18_9STRA|nr:unnamed protein product [Phytophthora lilii]